MHVKMNARIHVVHVNVLFNRIRFNSNIYRWVLGHCVVVRNTFELSFIFLSWC